MSQAWVTLDYDALVQEYWQSLTTVLRGFQSAPGVEFLEAWVPDDDHIKSLVTIIEAAKERGVEAVTIRLGPDTVRALDAARLNAKAATFGIVRLEVQEGALTLQVIFQNASASMEIHPAYRRALLDVLRSPTHAGRLESQPGLDLACASEQGVTLTALIDPAAKTVKAAAYLGAGSQVQRGLLEVVCAYAEGKPVQEWNDHAVIYAEHRLRDESMPPAVPGIVLPQNADAAFALPLRLVRGLVAQWRQAAGNTSEENRYDPPVSASWKTLSREERLAHVQQALTASSLGEGMQALRCEGDRRVVVRWTIALDQGTQQQRLRQLERHLKSTLEPTLQVYLEPKTDQNVLRQAPEGKG